MKRKSLTFRMLVLLFIIVRGALAAAPSAENCDYYLDREKETGCWFRDEGASDYLVKYGYKYCSIFRNRLSIWTDGRKDWVKKTTLCLQSEVQKEQTPINCAKLEDNAFDAHPGCYRRAGFCQLAAGQKTSIVWTAIGFDTLLSPRRSAYQGFVLLGDCMRGVPSQTTALYNRSIELAQEIPELRLSFIEAFDVGRLNEQQQKQYAQKFLEVLLNNNNRLNEKSYSAYSAIYGTELKTELDLGEIKENCLLQKEVKAKYCKGLEKQVGSTALFNSLKLIPTKIDRDAMKFILKYKQDLEMSSKGL